LFQDESKRKPFLVGLAVFIIVFIGLTIYQQTLKEQGDMILTGSATESEINTESDQDTKPDRDGGNGDITEGDSNDTYGDGRADFEGSASGQSGTDAEPIAIFVDIGGAVILSGLFALPAGSRVDDAIKAAGGLKEDADMRYFNRAAVLADGDRLYIPTESEVKNGTAPPSAGQVTASGGYSGNTSPGQSGNNSSNNNSSSGSGNTQSQNLININTAGSEELQKLNGVGPVTAQKIIDYRERHGPFSRIEELMNVSGIGAKTFEKLRNYITV
jgi:competence protein ComEA